MKLEIRRDLTARHLGKPEPGRATARLVGRDGKPIVAGVCLHDTAGTGTHNDTLYLANPSDGRSVSVDFVVERTGTIYQLNPDLSRYYTFHAGRATRFRSKSGAIYRNRDVTRVLIGIELCQKAQMNLSPAWPIEQVQAAAELCLFLCQTFGFGKEQITTHAAIIQDNSRTDPRGFPFAVFWYEFNRAANPAATDPTADPLGSPVRHTVQAGDTLFSLSKKYSTPVETIKALSGINAASNTIRIGQILTVRR